MVGGEKEALAKERRAGRQRGKEPRARRAHTRLEGAMLLWNTRENMYNICLKFNYDL